MCSRTGTLVIRNLRHLELLEMHDSVVLNRIVIVYTEPSSSHVICSNFIKV
jgi:hypothetical protein